MIKCYTCKHLIICGWHIGGANLAQASYSCRNYEASVQHKECEGCKHQDKIFSTICDHCSCFYTDNWEKKEEDENI